MLRLIGTLARIVFGLTLASLAAGLVTVLFIDIGALSGTTGQWPKTLTEVIDLALLAATHIGIFSSAFVLIAALIGEWFSIRALSYYLLAGIVIALLGFSAQYASEVAGQPTIFNNYAIKTFLTVGFFGGFVYWLAAGQFTGRGHDPTPPLADVPATETTARRADKGDGVSVVITRPPAADTTADRRLWRMPALERLKFAKRDGSAVPGVTHAAVADDDTSPSSRD
ncbi:hypothetical protein [Hyphomicrobium sp. MC8b]|uniref:hypothetical protein n=1 Tax=Hyphomicrobium sp. MC8b TaxID=300273 RepID=UPI003919DB01